jgi:signal peptidase I
MNNMTKNKWQGALFNFILPGCGNIYAGKLIKGIVVYILFLTIVIGIRFVAYSFELLALALTLIVCYYVYAIISGYLDARRAKQAPQNDQWYYYVPLVVVHLIIMYALQMRVLDKLTPINFVSIPTPAMDPTLQVGDAMAIKKTKTIERNDVTIFWCPDDVNTMYVKRCIGMPGDSLQIKNRQILINSTPTTSDVLLKYKYIVTTDGSLINQRILEKNKLADDDYARISSNVYQFYLTSDQADNLKKIRAITNVQPSVAPEGEREMMIYPSQSENHQWNTDFYGPIYIPKKGDEIELNSRNIDLYFKCIEFESESVTRGTAGLVINGLPARSYEFKENYFFMMGDNRHNSLDSRYWGLLPEQLVIGKGLYLYKGKSIGRIGKKII